MPASDIVIRGAREHNLRSVDVTLPRNKLICLTGVSGSGKSSLAFDTLYAEGQRRYVESLSTFARQFLGQMPKPEVDHISGLSPSISISQKSSGNNPRSTVGTLTDDLSLDRQMRHNIEVVVDRLKAAPSVRGRLAEAVDTALGIGKGNIIIGLSGEEREARSEEDELDQPSDPLAPRSSQLAAPS